MTYLKLFPYRSLSLANHLNSPVFRCVNKKCLLPTSRSHSSQGSADTFKGELDRYNGVTVNCLTEKCGEHNFRKRLEGSLLKWQEDGRKCAWFKINIKDASLVPILAQKGFHFHHARGDFLMMYKWLARELEPNLPPASHVNLGVGAMVFNEQNRILAISEKNYEYPHWKLPGGYVEQGEDIIGAAVREVKEETGVNCAFESLVTFRHQHNMMFGNSDIYVLVRMKALTEDIVISQREIKACKWMEVEEYTNHPHVHELNRLLVKKALEYKRKNIHLSFEKRTVKWATFVRDMNFLLIETPDKT